MPRISKHDSVDDSADDVSLCNELELSMFLKSDYLGIYPKAGYSYILLISLTVVRICNYSWEAALVEYI